MMKNLGFQIAAWRRKKGIKQKEFAELAGIAASTISAIEKGKREPNEGHLESISKALGIPYQVLVFLSLETEDVPEDKRAAFAGISKTFQALVEDLFAD